MARIGIMSFAHMHAFSYASSVQRIPGVELTAVWDDNTRRGRDMAGRFETRFVKDLEAFLNLPLEGVIICSENVKHRSMVEAAAAAGKWILCEKPLATTVADGKAMVAACRKARVGLGTAFPCRYIASVAAAREQVASGALGEVYAASCTNNGSNPGGWFIDPALAGGGATMDHTVHLVDLLRWFTGREFTRVYCENGTLLHPNMATDDVGVVHMEMEGGIKVAHIASWNRPRSFPTWGDVTLEIIAEKGVVSVDAFNQKINIYSDDVGKAVWGYWGNDADLALVHDFARAVDERREPTVTGEDGLRAAAVTVAAYKATQTGRLVVV